MNGDTMMVWVSRESSPGFALRHAHSQPLPRQRIIKYVCVRHGANMKGREGRSDVIAVAVAVAFEPTDQQHP